MNCSNVYDTPQNERQKAIFDFAIGVWIPGFVCGLGIFGNALSLVVLSRDRTHSPTFYSLRALASVDLLLLVCALCQQVIPMSCFLYDNTNALCLLRGYLTVYAWPVICIAQMGSIWLTVVITGERYIAICYPLQAAHLCSLPKIRMCIIILFVFSIGYNVPKFFEFRTTATTISNNLTLIDFAETHLRTNELYRFLYNTASYCLLIYILPLTLLSGVNGRIVWQLHKARNMWQHLNRKQQREIKATIMPLCIVFVFFICGTQSLLSFILDAVFVVCPPSWLQYYLAIVNLLVIFNSAVNFIIFYMFGKKFRMLLKRLFMCRRKKQKSYKNHSMVSFRESFRMSSWRGNAMNGSIYR